MGTVELATVYDALLTRLLNPLTALALACGCISSSSPCSRREGRCRVNPLLSDCWSSWGWG